jgi:hypothetical protein
MATASALALAAAEVKIGAHAQAHTQAHCTGRLERALAIADIAGEVMKFISFADITRLARTSRAAHTAVYDAARPHSAHADGGLVALADTDPCMICGLRKAETVAHTYPTVARKTTYHPAAMTAGLIRRDADVVITDPVDDVKSADPDAADAIPDADLDAALENHDAPLTDAMRAKLKVLATRGRIRDSVASRGINIRQNEAHSIRVCAPCAKTYTAECDACDTRRLKTHLIMCHSCADEGCCWSVVCSFDSSCEMWWGISRDEHEHRYDKNSIQSPDRRLSAPPGVDHPVGHWDLFEPEFVDTVLAAYRAAAQKNAALNYARALLS